MVKKVKQPTKELELDEFILKIKRIKEKKRAIQISSKSKENELKNLVNLNYTKDCNLLSKLKEFKTLNKVKSKLVGRNRF